MKVYEILTLYQESFDKISSLGVRIEDYKYVDLYNEYVELKGNFKMTYIVARLSEKYHISERSVYSIVERLGKECNLSAV